MYNKLTLENEGSEFEVTFNGEQHIVPTGKFEAEETLGNHIFGQANKWKIPVKKLSQPEAPRVIKLESITPVEKIVEAVVVEKTETKEETTEEVVAEKPKSKK